MPECSKGWLNRMGKRTLVVGASPNPARYAYTAVRRLVSGGHDVIALGRRNGVIEQTKIVQGLPKIEDLDTISLYISVHHQPAIYQYLLGLMPKRLIFNPGTENAELARLATDQGIEVVYGCTLVMLASGTF